MSCEARSLRAGRKRDPPKGIERARGNESRNKTRGIIKARGEPREKERVQGQKGMCSRKIFHTRGREGRGGGQWSERSRRSEQARVEEGNEKIKKRGARKRRVIVVVVTVVGVDVVVV